MQDPFTRKVYESEPPKPDHVFEPFFPCVPSVRVDYLNKLGWERLSLFCPGGQNLSTEFTMKADLKVRVTVTDADRTAVKTVVVDAVWARDDLILVWKWEPNEPGVPAFSHTARNARNQIKQAADGVFEFPESKFTVQSWNFFL